MSASRRAALSAIGGAAISCAFDRSEPVLHLGYVTDEIDKDFGVAVRVGTKYGIRRFEIHNLKTGRAPMCDAQELREVERIARGEGVQISALSPGLFKTTPDTVGFTRDMKELYPRCVDLAHRWNLPALIIFGFAKPGGEKQPDLVSSDNPPAWIAASLAEAAERAKGDGLVLMIEPEAACWADTGRSTVGLIRKSQSSNLRINWDPGNIARVEHRDPVDELAAAAPYIAHMHVKDMQQFPRGGKPEWVPVGEGIINYREHFARLQKSGFNGQISLEPHMAKSEDTVPRCKAAFDRAWAEASAEKR